MTKREQLKIFNEILLKEQYTTIDNAVSVTSAAHQEHFWRVVKACLQEFHDAKPAVMSRMYKLRHKIDEAPIEEIELFYHGEPFNVACGIGRRRLLIEPFHGRYFELRDGEDNHHETGY